MGEKRQQQKLERWKCLEFVAYPPPNQLNFDGFAGVSRSSYRYGNSFRHGSRRIANVASFIDGILLQLSWMTQQSKNSWQHKQNCDRAVLLLSLIVKGMPYKQISPAKDEGGMFEQVDCWR